MLFTSLSVAAMLCTKCSTPISQLESEEKLEVYFCTNCRERILAWNLLIKKKENGCDIVIPTHITSHARLIQRARQNKWHDEEMLLIITEADFATFKSYFNKSGGEIYTDTTTVIELYQRWQHKAYN